MGAGRAGAATRQAGRLQPAAAEVAEHVAPAQRRQHRVADDDAPGDRAVPRRVRALDDRRDVARGRAPGIAAAPLVDAPAEVGARAADDRDLLDLVLPDVGDDEVARRREREPPRVPQPVRVDLGARARAPHERVRAGHAVRPPALAARVDADDLPQHRAEVLRVVVLVAATAPVAEPGVEHPVRPEQHQPAVVVARGMRLGEDDPRRPAPRALGAAAAVLDDPDRSVAGRVVDVEAAAARVVGREGERQQAALAARGDPAPQVEERA